jgi:hypothetical protein
MKEEIAKKEEIKKIEPEDKSVMVKIKKPSTMLTDTLDLSVPVSQDEPDKCKKCESTLNPSWVMCPFCGEKIDK